MASLQIFFESNIHFTSCTKKWLFSILQRRLTKGEINIGLLDAYNKNSYKFSCNSIHFNETCS